VRVGKNVIYDKVFQYDIKKTRRRQSGISDREDFRNQVPGTGERIKAMKKAEFS
jgi:hypothetical protein